MAESTHKAEVVKIESITKHPNADSLEVINVYGYSCCVRLGQFKVGDLVVYIPPDNLVDTKKPEFSFLDSTGKEVRIKVRKLRGLYSQGLLIPAPTEVVEGDDVTDLLGIKHYEPPISLAITSGEAEKGPTIHVPVYNVESWKRYGANVFTDGELVIAREKIHGTNGRFLYYENRFWCGSRSQWKKENDKSVYWRALNANEALKEAIKSTEFIFFGEVYGQIQKGFDYGVKPNEPSKIIIFDILEPNVGWLHDSELLLMATKYGFNIAPLIYSGPYDSLTLEALSRGQSLVIGSNHIREGLVVRPIVERKSYLDPHKMNCERAVLKIVSDDYLSK